MSKFGGTKRIKTTLTSFMAYFVMSSVITPLGIVSQAMAQHFDTGVTATTALFSYLTTGILIGTFLSIFVYTVISIRLLNVFSGILLATTLASLLLVEQFWWLTVLFAIIGICCGLLLAAAVIVLTKTYSERSRARALLITDSFYSLAGVVAGFTTGQLLSAGYHWGSAYFPAIVVSMILVLIAAASDYPQVDSTPSLSKRDVKTVRWPTSVIVIGLALLIYIVSFIIIYSWVPVYASESLGATSEQGGSLVSRFFLGLFVGQLIVFATSFRVSLFWLLGGLLISSFAATFAIWNVSTTAALAVAMLALGFLSGGILKTLLTYGTMLVAQPTTKMVSFLLLCTAIGSSMGPAMSSLIVESFGTRAALVSVSVGYMITGLLVFGSLLSPIRPPTHEEKVHD